MAASVLGPFTMNVPEARYYRLSVDRELHAGDVIPVAGGFEVVHTPGHTPGSISLYGRDRGVLLTGAAIGNWFGLRLPLPMPSHDMAEANRSVRRLASLEYNVALPGHGHPIIGRASEKLADWTRRWLDDGDCSAAVAVRRRTIARQRRPYGCT